MPVSRREKRRKRKAAGAAKVYRVVAAILILGGLGIFGYAGYQWLTLRYHQAQLRDAFEATAGFRFLYQEEEEWPEYIEITEWRPMWLTIPAIGVDLGVLSDIETYNRDEVGNEPWAFPSHIYNKWINDLKPLLDKGPVYYQLSDLPSMHGGNVVIAGHRAGHWNFFRDMDKLQEGDEIYLDIDGYRFIYLVVGVEQVSANDWSMFQSTSYPAITLQTCTPLGVPNPPYRLNARGILQEIVPLAQTPEVD